MSKQTDFFQELAPIVQYYASTREKWVLPSVVLAQAALESGYNLEAKTLFGIKGEGVTLPTTEYLPGVGYVKLEDSFREYPSIAASVEGYFNFMCELPRYANVVCNRDYISAVIGLVETTDGLPYATDPYYTQKLINIIEKYDLEDYDECVLYKDEHVFAEDLSPYTQLKHEVIKGAWGNGISRKNLLERYGYSYELVQALVNKELGYEYRQYLDDIAEQTITGKFGNNPDRRWNLAELYEEVQEIVNKKLGE